MVCPKCQSIIKEGNLYCEQCGEEIHIVPEFETRVESEIKSTLDDLSKELLEDKNRELKEWDEEIAHFMEDDRFVLKVVLYFFKRKAKLLLGFLFVLFLIGLSIFFFIKQEKQNSFDYQYGRALILASSHNYEEAIAYMENAVLLDPDSLVAKQELADYYIKTENYGKAISLLKELITVAEYEEIAYDQLITCYLEQEKYDTISHLLLDCNDSSIQEKYSEYMAYIPRFSVTEGTYEEVVALKLSVSNNSAIYYTIDGTEPDENSILYTGPLFLQNGVYRVQAVSVNSFGIVSEISKAVYTIDTTVPDDPIIMTESGKYSEPTLIRVTVPENCDVFYTTDGTEPDENAILYETPILMPLDKSTYKFVAISYQGVKSSVISKDYELDLSYELTRANAVNSLVMKLTEMGILSDYNGYLPDRGGRNSYIISSAVRIEDQDYYLIWEFYEDESGNISETGMIYAVNVITNEFYTFEQSGESFQLLGME